jgi:hypothetical protein
VAQRVAIRTDVLAAFGAGTDVIEELLRYNENVFGQKALDLSQWPLPDESFVETWRGYACETEDAGCITPLSKYLVQLQFPVRQKISENAEYIAATRRGLDPHGMEVANGLLLREPEHCRVVIYPTAAGHMPLIIAWARADFIALVQALTHRNEPITIPDSMGACMVAGYNNWNRIAILREKFQAPASAGDSWAQEFERIKARKELYQDRFIILSTGPYSGVNATAMGLDAEEWLKISLAIRREHECTHYFTRRVFSSMRNNLLDELIADYMGITSAAGRFHADWLLRFLGLESYPHYREGGRLQNYRGAPPLSDAAFALLQKLVVAAAANLEDFDRHYIPHSRHSQFQPALLGVLTRLTIEEMASPDAPKIMGTGFAAAAKNINAYEGVDSMQQTGERPPDATATG